MNENEKDSNIIDVLSGRESLKTNVSFSLSNETIVALFGMTLLILIGIFANKK